MNSALIAAFIAALLVPWVFAVVIILIASRLRRDPGRRRQDFITAIGLAVLMGVNTSLNMWMAQHVPHTIDAWLWRWDEALRLDPLAVIYYMEEQARLYDFMQVVYYALPLVMAVAWIQEQSFTLRRAVAIAGVLRCFRLLGHIGILTVTPMRLGTAFLRSNGHGRCCSD